MLKLAQPFALQLNVSAALTPQKAAKMFKKRNEELEKAVEPFWLHVDRGADIMQFFEDMLCIAVPTTTFFFKDSPTEVRMAVLQEMQRKMNAALIVAQNQLLTHDMPKDPGPLQ